MRIANPIYDVIFKYLMEDIEIARRLISLIIGEEVVELRLSPQEDSARSSNFDIIIFWLDFKAVIKTKEGTHKKVLIELQKGKYATDIMRFRRYLGDNYRKEDTIYENGVERKIVLPILTIYFLGFPLKEIATPVLKVNREYIDLSTSQVIEADDPFIEKLTHDSFIIQISRLDQPTETSLERTLQVFSQSFIVDDNRILEIDPALLEDSPLTELITDRLRQAATEEKILREAILEEEVEHTIEQYVREKQELSDIKDKLQEERDELQSKNDELESEVEKLRWELERLKNQSDS